MKNFKFITLLVIAPIIFLALYFYKDYFETKDVVSQQNNSFFELSTWHTYNDIDNNVNFKYPNKFIVERGEDLQEPFALTYNLKINDGTNFLLAIIPLGSKEYYGTSTENIMTEMNGGNSNFKLINNSIEAKLFFDTNSGKDAYYLTDTDVYHIVIEGYNNSVGDTAMDMWENDFPHYLKLMEVLFGTFVIE